jgi:hypothetical protein
MRALAISRKFSSRSMTWNGVVVRVAQVEARFVGDEGLGSR